MIELTNLRVLNDYLNQTIDTLVRSQRAGASPFGHVGAQPHFNGTTPFSAPIGAGVFGGGVDALHGALSSQQWPLSTGAQQLASLYGLGAPTALGATASYPMAIDPFFVQRAIGYGPQLGGAWSPVASVAVEAARQAQINQALAARQMVLETMCRVAGITV